MNCDRAKELFSELHEGSLDAGLRLKAEEHLHGCASCAHEFEGFKALYGRLSSVPAPDAPANLSEVIARRLDKADWERRQSAKKNTIFRWLPVAAAAAVAITVFAMNRNRTVGGIVADPIGIPTNESRPLSVRIVDGKVHLQLRPAKDTIVSVYQGGKDFVTLPPLDAKLLRSDKVSAMARYNVPLDVSGVAETIWVMSSDANEPVHAVFMPQNPYGAGDQVWGTLPQALQNVAWKYGITIDAILKEPGKVRMRRIEGDTYGDCLTLMFEDTGLKFTESDGVVLVR